MSRSSHSEHTPRTYDSSGRRAQAARTRQAVLDAARELFLDQGYAATTIAAVAARAGVSGPTVYAAFGSKAGLLKQTIDVSLAGDDEPVAIANRPIYRWVTEAATQTELLRRLAVMETELNVRAAGLYDVLYRAADTEPELAELVATFEAQRLDGAERAVARLAGLGPLPAGRTKAAIRDAIWLANEPVQYTLLVTRRGWSRARYQAWFIDALLGLLEPPADVSGPSPPA